MFRSSRRAAAARDEAARDEAARNKVNTAAEGLLRTAADRVGPLAQSAADAIGAAADKVSPFAHSAADRVGPFAQTAADRVGPLASSAIDRVTPYAQSAAGRVTPLAQTAAGYATSASAKVAPLASSAKLRGTQLTQEAARRIGPLVDDAVVRVSPAMDAARIRVTGDLLPRLTGTLSAVGLSPVLEETRGGAEVAPVAAGDELVVAKMGRGRWVRRIVVVGAVGAAAVVVVRRFFGSKDADWQAARPTTPYVPPAPAPAETGPAATSAMVAEAGDDSQAGSSAHLQTAAADGFAVPDQPAEGGEVATEPAEDFAADASAPVTMLSVADNGDVEETVVDEVVIRESVADLPEREPVAQPGGDDGPPPRWSGEGIYVGTQPPEGYVIKGNGRSMKYHMPEAAGYGRTVAEVWFNSEDAAQQAGFVRAQR